MRRIEYNLPNKTAIKLEYDPAKVYPPNSYSSLFLSVNTIPSPGAKVLDMCSGTGVYAISMLLQGAGNAIAVDVSQEAIGTIIRNAHLNDVHSRLTAIQSDMYSEISFSEKFDLIVVNPPCMIDPGIDIDIDLPKTAVLSGADGTKHFQILIEGAPKYLKFGGRLVFPCSETTNFKRVLSLLDFNGFSYRITKSIDVIFSEQFLQILPVLDKLRKNGICDFFYIEGVPFRKYHLIEAFLLNPGEK